MNCLLRRAALGVVAALAALLVMVVIMACLAIRPPTDRGAVALPQGFQGERTKGGPGGGSADDYGKQRRSV